MGKDIIGGILAELNAPGSDVLVLLEDYQHPANDQFWRSDSEARLYRAFGKRLIGAGHLARAYELVQNGLVYHKRNPDLAYLAALALARAGNVGKSSQYADEVLAQPSLLPGLRVDAMSLKGRLKKDEYERTRDTALKQQRASESAALYRRAYAIDGDVFPGINASTMSLLAGWGEEAAELAAEIYEKVTTERRVLTKANDYWLLATLGEACIVLNRLKEAARWYREATELAKNQIGDRVSMRRQVGLLAPEIPGVEAILDVFNLGRLVVFAGHMIDHPERTRQGFPSRFPPNPIFERAVAAAIRKELDDLNATIGYASAACGSDILFGEQMRERGAECHVVLPFNLDDFYFTSVDFGCSEMRGWRERCDSLLAKPTEVHYATTEHFWDDRVLFEWVNTVTQGLAITHAARLGVDACALVVLDQGSVTKASTSVPSFGGTGYFLAKWEAGGGRRASVIDMDKIRRNLGTIAAASGSPALAPVTVQRGSIPRQVRALLFADVKNYTAIQDEKTPTFFSTFLDEVAAVIEASKKPPAFRNTWGDGLYLVFENVIECADFAMRLLERISAIDWRALGLPGDTAVRIGVHAGPVYRRLDPIIGRDNFFGSHVTRAARIEPMTTPGAAFTSEQFAAAMAVEGTGEFTCEFVGVECLAKDYDRCALYRLERR